MCKDKPVYWIVICYKKELTVKKCGIHSTGHSTVYIKEWKQDVTVDYKSVFLGICGVLSNSIAIYTL